MIKLEANQQRKAHRLHIPIIANIGDRNYKVIDWSVTGIGLFVDENDSLQSYEIGSKIDAILILPTSESSIMLNIELTLKVKIASKHTFGFEISHILEKNKRVLRHFASLAIEGDENTIENLTTDLFLQNTTSPIIEPISLVEEETKKLRVNFTKKVIIYFFLSFFLFSVIGLTLIYNYIVISSDYALVTGNSQVYKASKKGEVSKIFVKQSQKIEKGMALYEVTNTREILDLNTKEMYFKNLKQKLQDIKSLLRVYTNGVKHINALEKESERLDFKSLDEEKTFFIRAKKLYDRRLITFSHFQEIKKNYQNIVDKYKNRTLQNNKTLLNKQLDTESKLLVFNEKILLVKERENSLKLQIEELRNELIYLKKSEKSSITVAFEKGTVHSINVQEKELVDYKDIVLITQNNTKSYILARLKDKDISTLRIGQKVIVESHNYNKKYLAKLSILGCLTVDTSTKMMADISKGETPVRIDFVDDNVAFDLNEQVQVWIMNDNNLIYDYFESFLFN